MVSVREQAAATYEQLKGRMGYKNPMAAPRLQKIVINIGTGSVTDKNKIEIITDRLTKITGQKPAARPARKSIASFKIREGDVIGFQVTLRGKRMYDFLEKFVNVALPRTRDFQGVNPSGVDEMGNLTIGVREHTIFPETPDEEIKDVFGFSVTLVTSARSRDEAYALFEHLGIPFRKE